jgi:hypothetical protein
MCPFPFWKTVGSTNQSDLDQLEARWKRKLQSRGTNGWPSVRREAPKQVDLFPAGDF